MLQRFEEILPGSAGRIFNQIEEQSSHRRVLEAKVISSNAFSQRWGVVSASMIGITGVAGGIFLVYAGKDVSGLTTLIGTLASLVGVYLFKRPRQDMERAEKRN